MYSSAKQVWLVAASMHSARSGEVRKQKIRGNFWGLSFGSWAPLFDQGLRYKLFPLSWELMSTGLAISWVSVCACERPL